MDTQGTNLLLSSLSAASRELITARSTAIPLPLRTVLYRPEEVPAYAYFLTSGIASVVTTLPDGGSAEVGVIGHEGFTGATHLLGPAKVTTESFMQLAGTGLRVRFSDLQNLFRSSEEIRGRILEFVQENALVMGQLTACNRLHEAEERLARWLLMVRDRIEGDELHITQEFLAQMLGSRRTTVTVVAGALQRAGLIEYQRGRVKIVNKDRLEEAACDCYPVTKELFTNLYPRGGGGAGERDERWTVPEDLA